MSIGTLRKKFLFWDTKNVDFKKNKKFVIERVLMYGNENDFRRLLKMYSETEIKNTLKKSRALNKKSQVFWCDYFNINPLQCGSRSAKKQSPFWKK